MAELSDHELLILLRRDVEQLGQRLTETLTQLARGNARFEQIALTEQETKIALASLRQDFSRALLTADEAKSLIGKVQSEIAAFRTQARLILWLFGPIVGVVVAVALEFVKRLIWP